MDRKTVTLALCLITMMLLTGAATMATLGGTTDDVGSRGTRATSIDGSFRDGFETTDNLTLSGDVNVVDGELIVDRTVYEDAFGRFPLAPWEVVEGSPRISQGVMLTNGTFDGGSRASKSIDLHDLELQMDLSPGMMAAGGPIINLSVQGAESIRGLYSNGDRELQIWLTNSTGDHKLSSSSATLVQDDWYRAKVIIEGSSIMLELGPGIVIADHAIQGNFNQLILGVGRMDNAAWDNVTIKKLGGSGEAITTVVNLPVDTFWTDLNIDKNQPVGTTLRISLIDPSTGQPYTGLSDITSTYLNLEERLDPLEDTEVQLKMVFTAEGTDSPSVTTWKISWEGDPPFFIKPFTAIELFEDEGKEGLIDLRKHFEDRLTDADNLTFSVASTSNALNVQPVIDGHMLGFQLPTRDFYGTEYYSIRCSDGTLTVDSLQGTVLVKPLDDPPLIRPFGRIDMYEDEEHEFNLTPYLEDVDTPVHVLRLRADSEHVRVEGQFLYLNYDQGGTDRIEIVVSDYTNNVPYMIDVRIREVDDPPVFEPLAKVTMDEDQERTLDLADYVTDEDDALEDLLIDIEGNDRYISLDGLIITLLYDDTGGEFEYTVLVSDENNTVTRVLEVFVREVNDPPSVASVGGMTPEDGAVSWSMTEGNSTDLLIVVEDEESHNFHFTLVTDMDGASMVGSSVRLEPDEGEVGTYVLSVSISDGAAATIVKINVEVTNRNDPVQDVAISEPTNGTRVELGAGLTLRGYAFDPDFAFNQKLTYTWSSDLDGPLGTGKILEGVNLTLGNHVITLVVSDGEYSGEAIATVTVFKKDGGGGGGGGGDNGDGIGGGGMSTALIVGIIIALVIVGVVIFAVRAGAFKGSEQVTFSEPSPQQEPIESAAKAFDKPPERPEDVKVPGEREKPVSEADKLYGEDYKKVEKPSTAPAAAPVAAPVAAPADRPRFEVVARDTASMAESDPEQKRLDELKRKYQAAISSMPWGVPSSELAHMDWYELAAAMATGESKVLDDGRPVVKIGDKWYYSDTEDMANFLRRHA